MPFYCNNVIVQEHGNVVANSTTAFTWSAPVSSKETKVVSEPKTKNHFSYMNTMSTLEDRINK